MEDQHQGIMDEIHLDILRRIRDKKIAHLHKKILRLLQDHQDKMRNVHKELLMAVQKKEQVKEIKRKIHVDIKEKGKEMELANQIRKFGFYEIMTEQIVKHEELEDFLPRKLFFFGVENFKNCAKEIVLHNGPEVEKSEMQLCSGSSNMLVAEQKCPTTNLSKKRKKSKTKTNVMKNWAKRAFGRE